MKTDYYEDRPGHGDEVEEAFIRRMEGREARMKRYMWRDENGKYSIALSSDSRPEGKRWMTAEGAALMGLPVIDHGAGPIEIDLPEIRVVEPEPEKDMLVEAAKHLRTAPKGWALSKVQEQEFDDMAAAVEEAIEQRNTQWPSREDWAKLEADCDRLKAELETARQHIDEVAKDCSVEVGRLKAELAEAREQLAQADNLQLGTKLEAAKYRDVCSLLGCERGRLWEAVKKLTAELADLRKHWDAFECECVYCKKPIVDHHNLDNLRRHVETECLNHPMRKLEKQLAEARAKLSAFESAWQRRPKVTAQELDTLRVHQSHYTHGSDVHRAINRAISLAEWANEIAGGQGTVGGVNSVPANAVSEGGASGVKAEGPPPPGDDCVFIKGAPIGNSSFRWYCTKHGEREVIASERPHTCGCGPHAPIPAVASPPGELKPCPECAKKAERVAELETERHANLNSHGKAIVEFNNTVRDLRHRIAELESRPGVTAEQLDTLRSLGKPSKGCEILSEEVDAVNAAIAALESRPGVTGEQREYRVCPQGHLTTARGNDGKIYCIPCGAEATGCLEVEWEKMRHKLPPFAAAPAEADKPKEIK